MPKRIGTGIELLADPTRRQIVSLVARNVRRPSRIATELGLSRPAVSRQLYLLTSAGLLDAWGFPGDGRGRAYYLNQRMVPAIVAWLAGTEVGLTVDQRTGSARLVPMRQYAVEPSPAPERRHPRDGSACAEPSAVARQTRAPPRADALVRPARRSPGEPALFELARGDSA